MKKTGFLIGLLLLGACTAERDGGYKEIEASTVAAMLGAKASAPLLLDVRTREEYNEGFIPGAILIPVGELESRWGEIEPFKGKDVVVYCHSGVRSTRAAHLLAAKGFKHVYNYRGGFSGWKGSLRAFAVPKEKS